MLARRKEIRNSVTVHQFGVLDVQYGTTKRKKIYSLHITAIGMPTARMFIPCTLLHFGMPSVRMIIPCS
jgi:hypothetical protein